MTTLGSVDFARAFSRSGHCSDRPQPRKGLIGKRGVPLAAALSRQCRCRLAGWLGAAYSPPPDLAPFPLLSPKGAGSYSPGRSAAQAWVIELIISPRWATP